MKYYNGNAIEMTHANKIRSCCYFYPGNISKKDKDNIKNYQEYIRIHSSGLRASGGITVLIIKKRSTLEQN